MKNNLTEIVFILDKSGSMHGMEADVVGGFNSMLEKQKEADGEVLVSTVLFSNDSTVLHDRLPLEKIEPMRVNDFRVGGCTALLDAIGDAVHHVSNIHKYARPEDVPAHTVFVISTDGFENASRRYSSDTIKKTIAEKQEKYGWEFLFLAANIDAVETAECIGIRRERAVNYRQDGTGTRLSFEAMDKAIKSVRKSISLDSDGVSWREELDKDNEKRK